VNLLLVEPGEVTDDVVVIADRRADHLRRVLGATLGSRVRVGITRGGVGTAEVIAEDGARMTLRLAISDRAPPSLPIELVLAVPRPKALTRVIEAAAAFGVERITLTNAWRVDKSYLRSPRLAPESLALAARLGAEQGATTHLPEIVLHHRLMDLLDTRWPEPGSDLRLVAHPGGTPLERATRGGFATIAIGPEGGWIAREVETFVARGFTPVSLGATILRVDTAVAAALGQLTLLERMR
jgi:16S rRNA (uracil1498-N3)-methyltransferase